MKLKCASMRVEGLRQGPRAKSEDAMRGLRNGSCRARVSSPNSTLESSRTRTEASSGRVRQVGRSKS